MITKRIVSGLAIALALVAYAAGTAIAEAEPDPSGAAQPSHATDKHAADTGHAPNTSPLEFKKDLALWTGVVFLVLLAVLWKFAWGPIIQGLERREKGIANQISEAQRSNQQAQQLLSDYQQKLVDSKAEVRGMLEVARRDADQAGKELIEKAQAEAKAERQRALEEIDAATGNALKELADLSATLAVGLAGKIVRAELKPRDHARLIERAVTDFAGSKNRANGKS